MKKVSSAISLAVAGIALAASLVPAVVFANDSSTPDAYVEETEQSPTGCNGEDEANALSDNVALSAISINTNTYAHSATATSNGVTFTVEWNDSTTKSEATTFHITQTGGSSDAKVRMDVPQYWDNGTQESVCDPSRSAWGGYATIGDSYDYNFEFTASGTYRCLFYFMDTANNVYYLRTEASVTVDDASRPAVSTIVSNTVAQAKQKTNGSEYEMALWLHDWTLDQLEYDYSLNWCSAESGLTRSKGTCESYQRIYAKLLDVAGIANGRITGNGHTWNAVKIDGKWCQIDLTWDDSSDNWYDDFDQRHIYFGLTDELMAIAHSDHTANYQAAGYAYRSTDLSNNYFVRNGKADEWANSYKASIQQHLDAKETSFSVSATNASYPPGICGIQNGIIAAVLNEREWKTSDGTKVALNTISNITTISSTAWTAVFDFAATYYTETMSLSGASVVAPTQPYTGSALTPAVTVTLDGKTLVKGNDYTVSYERNGNLTNDFTSIGTITVIVAGKGAYTDTATGTFTISAASIANAKVTTDNQTYDGSALTPAPTVTLNGKTLTQGTDYTVAYSNNINAGTATVAITGKGNYTGTAKGTFTIKAADASSATVSTINQTYNGSARTPPVTVTLNGKTLQQGTDYTLSYSNNMNVGTAMATASFKGNYSGSATGSFNIAAASISSASVSAANQTYSGSALTPAVTVTLSGRTLTNGRDYTVTYSNNVNPGTATVTVTGKGNYTGTARGTFTINGANSATRLSGSTRYDTMASIVRAGFSSSQTVIVASGENFPDALGASSLAGAYGAPVVLTSRGSLSAQARSEISRLRASKAFIVGGTAALSSSVESELRGMGLSVERLAGNTRQETATKIAAKTTAITKPSTIIIAAGKNYPDALSVSPYAYAKGYPIYLAEGNGSLSASTLNAIRSLGTVRRIIIVGGNAAIATSAESQLRSITSSVERWSGATRYETSLKIAEKTAADGMSWTTVAIASGQNFPDALAGASLVGKNKGILLLSAQNDGSSATGLIRSKKTSIGKCYILGGEAAITRGVEPQVNSALS